MRLGVDAVDVDDVVAHLVSPGRLSLDADVRSDLEATATSAADVARSAPTYGRTTGVGANRNVQADDDDGQHGVRLVRSHAAGAGPDMGDDVARATMFIRAHQLAQPGSGIAVPVIDALCAAADEGLAPTVREFGGVGTGDITVLAELALCLLGERPWRDGTTRRFLDRIDASSALAFMSSSAPTLAVAALAASELRRLSRAWVLASSLSLAAVRANPQHWSPVAEQVRPSAGVSAAAATFRSVLDGGQWTTSRTQDPLAFRCMLHVAGPLWEAVDELVAEVDRCLASPVENPRFAEGEVWHHGAFMLTSLALRLDTFRLALTQWMSTSHARLTRLMDPAYTRGANFLADGPAGSSGAMVLEYTASSALETARGLADPVTRHTLTISLGTEDHASFALRAATATRQMVAAARVVAACEAVAAVRALRMADDVLLGPGGRDLLARAASLPDGTADRSLVDDLALAEHWLDEVVIVR